MTRRKYGNCGFQQKSKTRVRHHTCLSRHECRKRSLHWNVLTSDRQFPGPGPVAGFADLTVEHHVVQLTQKKFPFDLIGIMLIGRDFVESVQPSSSAQLRK